MYFLFNIAVLYSLVSSNEAAEVEVDDLAVTDISPVIDPVPESYMSGLKSYLRWSPDNLHAHHNPSQDQFSQHQPEHDYPQDRSLSLHPGLGWAVGTAIMIFAFANTVLVGSTLAVTYIIYQILLSVLAVIAPGAASVFASLLGVFS